MTPNQAAELRSLIEEYAKAEIDESWKGSSPPEEMEMITLERDNAWLKLDNFIKDLEQKP